MPGTQSFQNRPRTKIVATIGPACQDEEALSALVTAGVDVFRINTAHGDRDEHQRAVEAVRRTSRRHGRPIGILVDLAGPKIRLGQLRDEPTHCRVGADFYFVRGRTATAPNELTASYTTLVDELSVGDSVMLADGTVGMTVIEKEVDRVRCRVTAGGTIRSRQGINLPGTHLSIDALTAADADNAVWAAEKEIDFVGLSFVRSDGEVRQLKTLLSEHGSRAWVIAKIEKREALDNLEAIVTAADGVMVARGDLGVETDVAEIAVEQKRIIRVCSRLGKPVIVATQMLDSMQHSPRPTRAEATDVANAILDGTDACMLSGETAIGDYPREAVTMMNRIMLATERTLRDAPREWPADVPILHVGSVTRAVVYGAGRIAERLGARMVVVASHSGATALAITKQRDFAATVGVSDSEATLRRMCLLWGVTPVPGAPVRDLRELCRFIDGWGRAEGGLSSGDRIVVVSGTGTASGVHNAVVVHEIP